MIATVSADENNIDESISTCKFAQRVACIKNDAIKNEQVDPSLVIQRLKTEVAELKAEIRLLKGVGADREHLEADEVEDCRRLVEEYLENKDPGAKLILSDMLKITECLSQFKRLCNQLKGSGGRVVAGKAAAVEDNSEEVQRLRLLVQQRDNEIAILLSHLSKQKGEGMAIGAPSLRPPEEFKRPLDEVKTSGYSQSPPRPADRKMQLVQRDLGEESKRVAASQEITAEQLQDRNKAFDVFRKSYRKNQAMEENKQLLKQKITQAKGLTDVINQARSRIEGIKNEIEQIRREYALQGLVDESNVPLEHPKEAGLGSELERYKDQYRKSVAGLRELKSEIEQIQLMLKNSQKKMQADFESWLQTVAMRRSEEDLQSSRGSLKKDDRVNEQITAFYKARDEIISKAK
jgi:kinesin family protein 6/9